MNYSTMALLRGSIQMISEIAIAEGMTLKSQNAYVVSVLQNGKVIGNAPGEAEIYVEEKGQRIGIIRCTVQEGEDRLPLLLDRNNRISRAAGPMVSLPPEFSASDKTIRLERKAARAFCNMCRDAQKQGVWLYATHGHRTVKNQKELIKYFVELEGEEKALKRCAPPGYSEHHSGLAVDVNGGFYQKGLPVKNGQFAWDWLAEHCFEYGFMIKNLKGKEHITGTRYEPWHIRYLGDVDLCQELHRYHLTLNEYLDRCDEETKCLTHSKLWRNHTMKQDSEKMAKKEIHIVVAGDIMTHGNQIREAFNTETGRYDFTKYFDYTKKYIQKADVAICNLETTLAGGEKYSGFPRFNTPDDMADAIVDAGFQIVATANNHSYDNGHEGIIRTKSVLEDRGLLVVGTKKCIEEEAYAVFSYENIKIGVLNYTYETAKAAGKKTLNNRVLNESASGCVNSFCFETIEDDLKRIEKDVEKMRAGGVNTLLVYYHWGNEYEEHSNVLQKYIAYRTAKMGVDIILGSHAHVLQEMQVINVEINGKEKKVPVYYGLGNYVWGVQAMPGREKVCYGALAQICVRYEDQSIVEILPEYVPLYIDIQTEEKTEFRVLPLVELNDIMPKLSVERIRFLENVRVEIDQVLQNKLHPAPTRYRFDRLIEILAGTKVNILSFLDSSEKYVKFLSEDAIVASVLQNGDVVGNSAGYVGITAVNDYNEEILLMVHVIGEKTNRFPIIVNQYNSIRDIYLPADRVKGNLYGLTDDISLCREAALAWRLMKKAASLDHIYLNCVGGFRTKKIQLLRINRYADRFGREAAYKRYMPVGCSEHHLGTSLDVAGNKEGDNVTSTIQAIRWVQQNAYKFGFVVRKPKSSLNRMAYIHVRFLPDKEEVQFINAKKLSLEEYLQKYDEYQIEKENTNVWKKRFSQSNGENSRDLTLRLICKILEINVPQEFVAIQDRIIPKITLSDSNVEKGSVFFYDKMLSKEMQKCRNALRSGAVLAFAEEQIVDECGSPMPTIIVKDSIEACTKIGRYIRELYPAKTVCVTGSAGKTTTQELIYQVLSSRFCTHTCYNNANNRVNILRLIQNLKPEHEMYVQEVGGSFPHHIEKSSEMLQPDVAVITNISSAHLDLYKSLDKYIEDKLSILQNVKEGGMALVNIDNDILKEYVGKSGIVTYGLENNEADYSVSQIQQDIDGLKMVIWEKRTGRNTTVKVDMVGIHNAYNVVAAFVIGRWAHMTEEEIILGLEKYHAKGIRQSLRNIGGYHLYIDCFSSVEISLISSMKTLSEMPYTPGNKKIAVIWELMRLGEESDKIYQRIAAETRNLKIDTVLIMGEGAKKLAEEMAKGRVDVRYTVDWNEMNQWILDLSRPGDILLFKGQHMQSIVLTLDYVFGTDYYINNIFERKTKAKPFINDKWEGVTIDKKVAVLERKKSEDMEVYLPEVIEHLPVIYVNKGLYANSSLCSIKISNQIVGIGQNAFAHCHYLEKVEFGKSVRYIGTEAFYDCTALTEIILPRGCSHIDQRAFANCKSLRKVVIPRSVGFIAEDAFEGCEQLTLEYE